jgi:hypothetical protein
VSERTLSAGDVAVESVVVADESQHALVESQFSCDFSLLVLQADSEKTAARARMLSAFMICFCLFLIILVCLFIHKVHNSF